MEMKLNGPSLELTLGDCKDGAEQQKDEATSAHSNPECISTERVLKGAKSEKREIQIFGFTLLIVINNYNE